MTTDANTAPAAAEPAPTPSTPVQTWRPQAELSQEQAAKMAQWAREDLLAGKITQAQADKQFDELNTPLDQRGPDTRSAEEKQLDSAFPPAKASEYQIRYDVPGQESQMTPELQQFDQNARTWMSTAGFPRETGNSLVNAIAKVSQTTKGMSPEQLDDYGAREYERLKKVHGPALEERLQLAASMIHALEGKTPGLKQLLKSKGIGDNAIVANLLIAQAQKYHARLRAQGK